MGRCKQLSHNWWFVLLSQTLPRLKHSKKKLRKLKKKEKKFGRLGHILQTNQRKNPTRPRRCSEPLGPVSGSSSQWGPGRSSRSVRESTRLLLHRGAAGEETPPTPAVDNPGVSSCSWKVKSSTGRLSARSEQETDGGEVRRGEEGREVRRGGE